MIAVSHRVGCLVVVRMVALVTEEEFTAFEVDLRKVFSAIRGPLALCSDIRGAQVVHERVAAMVAASMRRANPRVVRAAILLPTQSAVLALQFERIIREAGNMGRRAFRDVPQAAEWLSEVLNAAEQRALRSYLDETTPNLAS